MFSFLHVGKIGLEQTNTLSLVVGDDATCGAFGNGAEECSGGGTVDRQRFSTKRGVVQVLVHALDQA
jgi:hypothetical protein